MQLVNRTRDLRGCLGALFKPSVGLSGVVPERQITRSSDRLILLLCLILVTTICAAETKPNIPDWVRQAAVQKLPAYPPDTNAVVLFADETDTVNSFFFNDTATTEIYTILRPAGRKYGNLAVHIGKDEKLLSIHAWSIDSAGHEYELKQKDFIDAAEWRYELYSDISYKRAVTPGSGPGSIVAFEYEIKRRDYFNELHWELQRRIPVLLTTLNVQLPPGWELKEHWSGTPPVKSAASGPNGWMWTKDNLSGIDDEPDRPVDAALEARLSLELYTPTSKLETDWAALGKWASNLFRPQRSVSPEMTSKVQELTAGKSSFEARVRTLTEFLQREVRYVEIQIGIGGYQPHPASDVFHARYGDCKDKANLLSALLSQIGISSEMVLIHTDRGIVRPESPGNFFDHAILAIELPPDVPPNRYSPVITAKKSGKRYIIFDPTDEWTPFGEVRSELQDSYALLVTDSGGELIHVPIAQPDRSRLTRSAKLKLTADGTLSGSVEEFLTGDFATNVRGGAEYSNEQQRISHYEYQVTHSVKNASLQGLTFDGLKELNQPVNVRYNLNADRYAQVMGPLLIVRPRVLGVKSIGLDRKPRKYPLVIGNTALETDDFELQIPAGYTLDDKPDPVSLDTPFASYKSHIEILGDRLHYSREYVMKSLEIAPDKIEDLRAFENRVAADENAAVVFKKVPVAQGQD